MKKLLIVGLLVVLCLAALAGGVVVAVGPGAALALVGLGGDTAAAAPQADHAAADGGDDGHGGGGHGEEAGHGAVDAHGAPLLTQNEMPLLPFPEMIVNVTDITASGRQTSRFLKINMALVYDESAEGADRLPARELYLRDSFQDFLRQLRVSDLQGSRGLALLKTELLRRARAVGNSAAPRDILISDMVIQ